MEQLGLQFTRPKTTSAELVELETYLARPEIVGWMKAEQIGVALGWSDRKVRALASDSDLIASSPGRPGYKLVKKCTVEEYHRYRNGMLSQARKMSGRVMRTDRVYHGLPAV